MALADEILLLEAVETGEERFGVNRRQFGDQLVAGYDRFGNGRRQRRPACAQDFDTVPGLHFLLRVVEFRIHVVTLKDWNGEMDEWFKYFRIIRAGCCSIATRNAHARIPNIKQ